MNFVLINNYYKNSHKTDKCDDTHIIFDDKDEKDTNKNTSSSDTYVEFKFSSDSDNSEDDIDDI